MFSTTNVNNNSNSNDLSATRRSDSHDEASYHGIPLNIAFDSGLSLSDDEDLYRSTFRSAPGDIMMNHNNLVEDHGFHSGKEALDFGMFDGSLFGGKLKNGHTHMSLSDSMFSDSDDFSYLCSSTMSICDSSDRKSSLSYASSLFSSTDSVDSVASICSSLSAPNMCFKSLMDDATCLLDSYNQRHVQYSKVGSGGIDAKIRCPLLPCSTRYCLEKGKHFSVKGSTCQAAEVIEEAIISCAFPFSFDSNTSTWSTSCPLQKYFFNVNLYQSTDDSRVHVIEIRRMMGCCLGFTEIYSKLAALIQSSDLIQVVNENEKVIN